jgi:hypothetical protein
VYTRPAPTTAFAELTRTALAVKLSRRLLKLPEETMIGCDVYIQATPLGSLI